MKSKKSGCFKVLLIFVLVIVAMIGIWGLANFGSAPVDGKPLFEPNALANHIVSPINKNGDVDYIEAINLAGSDGVTPQNNAMVKFVQAIGPCPEGALIGHEYFERLGIVRPDPGREYFLDFTSWSQLNSEKAVVPEESSDDDAKSIADDGRAVEFEVLGSAAYEPTEQQLDGFRESFFQNQNWNREEFPRAATWVDYNEKYIDLVKEGLQRSRYYSPLAVADGAEPILINCQLSYPQQMRALARQFSVRVGMFIGDKDYDSAFQEVMSTYRLAKLTRNGQTLVEELVAIAIQGLANNQMHRLMIQDDLTAAQLRNYLGELETVGRTREMARIISNGERYLGLDVLQNSARTGKFPMQEEGNFPAFARIVDPEQAMIVLNGKYDELVEMFSGVSDIELLNSVGNYEDHMMAYEVETMDPMRMVKTVLGGRRAKGNHVGRIYAGMLLPAVSQVYRAEVRSDALLRITKIRLAIEIFHKENGHYPEKLEELVPAIVTNIPKDPFVMKLFSYKVDNGKVALYSVGKNGVDEGGKGFGSEDRSGEDDWQLEEIMQQSWEEFLKQEKAANGN